MKNLAFSLIKRTALLLLLSSPAMAQTTIAGFEVNGLSGYGPSPLTATTAGSNVTVGGLTRGTGLTTTGTAATNAFGASGWDNATATAAAAANEFFSFSVTVNSGTVSFGNFQFNYRRSNSGPNAGQLQYSTDGTTFTDVPMGAFAYPLTTSTGGTVSASLTGVPNLQNVVSATTVTFRLVNFGATSSGGTFYVNNGAGEDLVVTTAAPLSTNLLSFTAQASDRTAKLSWTTSCASTTQAFSVEHSSDGQSFAQVGRVEVATGECITGTREYGFETAGRGGLYRLAMHDASGRISYSRTLSIGDARDAAKGIQLYPSPAANFLQVEGMQPGSVCRILDATGRTVLVWTATEAAERVAINHLPAGTYLFVSESAGARVAQRFSRN